MLSVKIVHLCRAQPSVHDSLFEITISQCVNAKQLKSSIQVVTVMTNHDQSNKGHAGIDT